MVTQTCLPGTSRKNGEYQRERCCRHNKTIMLVVWSSHIRLLAGPISSLIQIASRPLIGRCLQPDAHKLILKTILNPKPCCTM